jgi:hypothetical protein
MLRLCTQTSTALYSTATTEIELPALPSHSHITPQIAAKPSTTLRWTIEILLSGISLPSPITCYASTRNRDADMTAVRGAKQAENASTSSTALRRWSTTRLFFHNTLPFSATVAANLVKVCRLQIAF